MEKDSEIADSAKLYEGVRIVNSNIGEECSIGDFSRVYESKLDFKNRIDRNVLFYNSQIGNYSYIGRNSTIMHSNIGKFCSISWNVTIGPANHDYSFLTTHDFLYNDFYNIKPESEIAYDRFAIKTTIKNDVWIGANAVIMNGVTIHNGAVIGAGSIVTKDVPAYAIVVGNPAKIIKSRFDENTIKDLQKLKWWNFSEKKLRSIWDLILSKNINQIINNNKT